MDKDPYISLSLQIKAKHKSGLVVQACAKVKRLKVQKLPGLGGFKASWGNLVRHYLK